MSTYDPKIVIFCCNWCSYAGADLAGVSRFQIDPNFRVIRTMCSGRIQPEFILSAFANGADGVMITGCHPGDCHYINGNYKTIRRYHFIKFLLKAFGVDIKRVRLEFISAGEGIEFQRIINTFIEEIKTLGPAEYKIKEKDDGAQRREDHRQ
jgi:F420-non-reducing hydrogenase iron-sulfur subunit